MKPLYSYFEEKIDAVDKEQNIRTSEADADLYEAILELNEKLTNTMSAIADLYELLIAQSGE